MKLTYTLVIQSSTTGRFLLKENNGVWGFAITVDYDPNVGALYQAIKEANVELGFTGQDETYDQYVLDYVGDFAEKALFHVTIKDEPLADDSVAQWHHLFCFPEPFDPATDVFFDSKVFMDKIV